MIHPTGTHTLNPFRARPNNRANNPGVTMGNTPGDYDPDNARGFALKLPIMVAGWGYDIFGRPVPNHAKNLSAINANPDPSYYGFANSSGLSAQNPRGTPPPYGAEVPPEKYIGGVLDVRYNQRHGVWQTDHGFYARITSVTKATGKRYVNLYNWEEVEVTKNSFEAGITEPFNRAVVSPANGQAVNIAELSTNTNDAVYSSLPIGTIIELKSHLVEKSGDGDFTLRPIYLFNQPTNQNVFLRIHWDSNQGYPAPLTVEDASYNNLAGMSNRFLYLAEVMYFDAAYTGAFSPASPFGGFRSYSPQVWVQAINIMEFGNPVGLRGVVAPGVITATGSLTNGTPNLSWPGSNVPANAKSAYPSGFSIRPIWHNTYLEAKRLTGLSNAGLNAAGPVYYFAHPNAHDGSCETGIWPFYNATIDSTIGEHTAVKRTQ